MDLEISWRGSDLARLLDEGHSRLQAAWKARLEGWGWTVVPEASFNRYGDRGRFDLLAWHRLSRNVLVVEIKTAIVDAQALLGSLDVKVRVARAVAGERGWESTSGVVPCLIIHESRTNRRRIAILSALLSGFDLRGRDAAEWLRRPVGLPHGLLMSSDLSPAAGSSVSRVGRYRVRLSSYVPRVIATPSVAKRTSGGG